MLRQKFANEYEGFMEEEREELIAELERYRTKVVELEKVCSAQSKRIAKLSEHRTLDEIKVSRPASLELNATVAGDAARRDLERLVSELSERETRYLEKIQSMQQILAELVKQEEQAKKSSLKWQKSYKEATEKTAGLESELRQLRELYDNSKSLTQTVQSLEDRLAAEKDRSTALEKLNASLQSLWQNESNKPVSDQSLNDGPSLFSEVEERRVELERRHRALEDSHELLKKAHAISLQQIDRLKSQLSRATQLIQVKESEASSSTRVKTLMAALAQLEAENEDLKRRLLRAQQSNQLPHLTVAGNGKAGNLASSGECVPNGAAHTLQLETLQRQLKATVRELETTQIMRTSETDRIRELESSLASFESKLQTAHEENAQLRFLLRDQKERSQQLQGALNSFLEGRECFAPGENVSVEKVSDDSSVRAFSAGDNESDFASMSNTLDDKQMDGPPNENEPRCLQSGDEISEPCDSTSLNDSKLYWDSENAPPHRDDSTLALPTQRKLVILDSDAQSDVNSDNNACPVQ